MRIAQLAPVYERVPPVAYGGTELVVGLITDELVARGHDVTLFASGDSQTAARLRSVTPKPVRYGDIGTIRHPEWVQLANVQACFAAVAAGEFDLVHNNAGPEGLVLAATSATPVLTTTHTAWTPETVPMWDAYPWFHHGVSESHNLTLPERGRLAAIHHGLRVESYTFSERPDGYLLFLGRFSPEKGPDVAVEVARRTGRRLLLAGKVDPADSEFFETHVRPFVDDDRIRLVGEADADHKRDLLAGADGLLFPIRWDEPFGLVMIEALASGTPVLSFARGSVPEVIEDGATGYVLRDGDVDGLARAIDRLGALDRRHCRTEAERRFGVAAMVDRYESAFAEVLARAAARGPGATPANGPGVRSAGGDRGRGGQLVGSSGRPR